MKLKRISALILSSFICLNSYVFSFGEKREILTVETAVNQALKYSKKLKNYDEENEINNIEAKQTKLELIHSGELTSIADLAVQLKEKYAKIETNKLSSDKEKESIEYSIFSFFIDIIKAENTIKLYDEEVKLKEKELKISEVKLKYGKISKNDYENEQLEYRNLLKQKNELQSSIDNAYVSLNKVLGNDLNKKYSLDLGEEIIYTSIGNTIKDTLESKIITAIDQDGTIKSQQTNIDIAKYDLKLYTSESGDDKKAAKTNEYNKALRTLEDTKTTLRENITKNCNEIIKNENEYKSNIAELENMQNQLKIKELNLQLGKLTEIEIEKYEYEIKKLENTIKEQTYEHMLLIKKYENPSLLID